jgi:hypothetical protein
MFFSFVAKLGGALPRRAGGCAAATGSSMTRRSVGRVNTMPANYDNQCDNAPTVTDNSVGQRRPNRERGRPRQGFGPDHAPIVRNRSS